MDGLVTTHALAAAEIQHGAIGLDALGAGQLGPRPARQRLDARQHLARAERLGHVVVGPEREAAHLVVLVDPRGEHHDEQFGPAIAQAPAHLEPVEVRQSQIEQHQADIRGEPPIAGRQSIPNRLDLMTRGLEQVGEP